MEKKFIKVPVDRFERIMFAVALSESISGVKVTREELMDTINSEGLELTPEQVSELDENFK